MITIKEHTTLVGVSELRAGIDKILEQAAHGALIRPRARYTGPRPQA